MDRAIVELQKHYYITVAGNRRKIGKSGEPYGWPANVYVRVTDWAPAGWLDKCADLEKAEAGCYIIDTGLKMGNNLKEADLRKVLAIS